MNRALAMSALLLALAAPASRAAIDDDAKAVGNDRPARADDARSAGFDAADWCAWLRWLARAATQGSEIGARYAALAVSWPPSPDDGPAR